MNEMNENKLVPKLRFPEFLNDGEWEESLLCEISPSIFDGTHQTPKYTEEGIPFFSVENVISGNKNKFISREDYLSATSKNKPEKGDIIITRIGNIGTSKVVDWAYEFSVYVTLAIVKKSEIFNSNYLHSYFQSNRYQKEILSKSLLNAVPCKINMEELRRTKVLLPPDKDKKEQQKIADCLSSLDEVIAAESRKLEALKEHKKGLLQNLFPQAGETVPKLRFKEFEDSGEWEEKKLGEVIEKILTGPFGSMLHQSDYVKEGIPVINPQNLIDGKIVPLSKTMIDDNTFTRLKKYALKIGEIVIARRGEMGRCAVVKEENVNWLCGTGSFVIRVNPKKSDSDFLNIILNSEKAKQQLEKSSIGATMSNLNQTILAELPISIPSFSEQQKIADCLSSVDDLISAQSQKIEALKLHKKGLLQGLFPQIND